MDNKSLWIRNLNLLKIKWKALDKESKLFHAKKGETEIQFHEVLVLEQSYAQLFRKDSLTLKRNIFKIRRLVQRLQSDIQFSNLPKEYIEKFDILKNDMDLEIKSLNEKITNRIGELFEEEKLATAEIEFINSQLESSSREEDCKPRLNIKPTLAYTEFCNMPEEIIQFDKFLQMNEGHMGGWKESEHSLYLQHRRKHKGQPEFLDLLTKVITYRSREEILKHENWYVKYTNLLESKKDAILRWKKSRSQQAKDPNQSNLLSPSKLNVSSQYLFDKNEKPSFEDNDLLKIDLLRNSDDYLEFFSKEQVADTSELIRHSDKYNCDNNTHLKTINFNNMASNGDIKVSQKDNFILNIEAINRTDLDVDKAGKRVEPSQSLFEKDSKKERARIKEKIAKWKTEQDKLNKEKEITAAAIRCEQKKTEDLKMHKKAIEREKINELNQEHKMELVKLRLQRQNEEEKMLQARKQYASMLAKEYTDRELEKFKLKKNSERIIRESMEKERNERLEKIKSKVAVSAPRDRKRFMQPTFSWIEKEKPQVDEDRIHFDVLSLQHKLIPEWRRRL